MLTTVVRSQSVLMIKVVLKVRRDGVADLRHAPGALGAVDNGPTSVFLSRLAIFSDNLQVLDVQCVQILLQL